MGIDPDYEANVLRERAGLGRGELCGGPVLAAGLNVKIRKVPARMLRGLDAFIIRIYGKYEICVREGLTVRRLHWAISHELGEMRLGELNYCEPDVEDQAHAIAASILMPAEDFRAAAHEHQNSPQALADDYLVDQTAASLRLAETGAAEAVAVVCKTRVLVRSRSSFSFPSEAALRKAANVGMPGLRRVQLTDNRNRIALVAA